MRLANHWSTHNYCDIVLGTTDKWSAGMQNPAAYGDPFPRCIDGEEVTVWSDGRWQSEAFREALENRVVAILNRALAEVAAVQSWKHVIEICDRDAEMKRRAETANAALALAIGG